jgi:hypothetical protein
MANPELRKTVLVGLGGAGQLILTHVKRFFLDTYNVLPPCIKLLSLDTDGALESLRSKVRSDVYKLDPHEFLHLKVAQAREFVESDPVVQQWYAKPITVAALENGAGAIRQNGRLAFFYHIVEVKSRIDRMIAELNAGVLPDRMRTARATMGATTDFQLSDKAPEIYVCGSLAGGTGSGIFLDVGILLRHLMPTALVHGYFLLNWVYRNKAFAHRVRGNAYAALAELDNLQSITYGASGSVPYTVKYADLSITVKEPPYSLFHIIDGRNERGENIDDVRALCETAANAIFLCTSAMSYPIASVTDNLLAHISTTSPKVWDGRNPRYSSFGVSAICYPAIELHRLLAANTALDLCRAAIADTESGMLADTAIPDAKAIGDAVQAYFTKQELTRELIPSKVCPHTGECDLQPEPFEIADPSLLHTRADAEEQQLVAQLEEAFNGEGSRFIAKTRDAFATQLGDLERKPELTTAYRQQWVDQAMQCLKELDHEAATQVSDAAGRIDECRKTCQELLQLTMKSRYLPWVGGPRKSAAVRWAGAVVALLEAVREKAAREYERRLYEAILRFLDERRPAVAPTAAEVVTALRAAADDLAQHAALEERNLRQLKATPTLTLVGDGDVVYVRRGETLSRSWEAVRYEYQLTYDAFKTEQRIQTIEDYLRKNREHPQKLSGVFLAHCREKLQDLTSVNVHQAITAEGTRSGDAAGYSTRLFGDLFRKAAPLWCFHRSRISAAQSMQYDNVVNVGVDDPEAAQRAYGPTLAEIKAKSHIRSDSSFSRAGDPWRIWMLNYAAALPVHLLQDLGESRERYLEEITPTYHVDPLFEMNVPDLFPVTDIENRSLRVLGMAIVKGIDVIRDEKLVKGHKFTCDLETVKSRNFGEPKVWLLFRDMFAEVKDTYNPNVQDNLLDLLVAALRTAVASLPREQLRNCIQSHVEYLERKLAQRDFTKLVSARLTYRETTELKGFLDPRGYAMDIARYIAGR